jgi:hypothetical protein
VVYCDGRKAQIAIAVFFRLRDAKIANFTEVEHFEGDAFDLENQ